MIRTLLAHHGGLARGALAFLLSQQPDIEVVAEVDSGPETEPAILHHQPDVSLVDLDLTLRGGIPVACDLGRRQEIRMLVLAERHRVGALVHALRASAPWAGVLAKDHPPDRLFAAIRAVAGGQPVHDAEPARMVWRSGSPLTPREREVLWMAAAGVPVRDIAVSLRLSCGTVQNHLSRIINKTGARSRVEAVNTARHAGWI